MFYKIYMYLIYLNTCFNTLYILILTCWYEFYCMLNIRMDIVMLVFYDRCTVNAWLFGLNNMGIINYETWNLLCFQDDNQWSLGFGSSTGSVQTSNEESAIVIKALNCYSVENVWNCTSKDLEHMINYFDKTWPINMTINDRNDPCFAGRIFQCFLLIENVYILIHISLRGQSMIIQH